MVQPGRRPARPLNSSSWLKSYKPRPESPVARRKDQWNATQRDPRVVQAPVEGIDDPQGPRFAFFSPGGAPGDDGPGLLAEKGMAVPFNCSTMRASALRSAATFTSWPADDFRDLHCSRRFRRCIPASSAADSAARRSCTVSLRRVMVWPHQAPGSNSPRHPTPSATAPRGCKSRRVESG